MSTSRLTNRDNLPVTLAVVASLYGTAILLSNSELFHYPLPLSVLGFMLCLATLTRSTIILFRRARYRTAVATLVVTVILFCFSDLNLYGKHSTPWPQGGPHSHPLWDLDHNH